MLGLRQFAWIALAEADSLLLLLVAMVFKYGFDQEAGVSVMGPIHGVLFLFYIGAVFVVRGPAGWTLGQTAKMIFAGILPIAGLIVGERLIRDQKRSQLA